MFTNNDVNGVKDRLNVIFDSYNLTVNDINEEVWSGQSKNNFVQKADEFQNEFKGQLITQLEYLSQAVVLYENYKNEKNNLNIIQSNYNLAVSNEDSEMITMFSNQINESNSRINSIKSQIENALGIINSIVLEGSDLAQHEFVNYYQTDYSESYGGNTTIASSGCGPTSMAMVLTYLKGEEIDPVKTAEWSMEHGKRVVGNGTDWTFFNEIASEYGINSSQQGVSGSEIINNLQAGNPIIMSMGPGHFTSQGHFIVLTGINEDGTINVADPNSRSKSDMTWDLNVFLNEGKQMWSFSN